MGKMTIKMSAKSGPGRFFANVDIVDNVDYLML